MSCNGCRVLRRGCSESCILRPCLQWIENPKAQANATLFVSKFFGRSDLMAFISAVPDNRRPALFQSLLFEACGRTVNPVNGAVGLLLTGNWHVCQAAVQTVLAGGTLRPVAAGILTPEKDEASERFGSDALKLRKWDDEKNFNYLATKGQKEVAISFNSEESEMMINFEVGDYGVEKLREEEPKLLNLFV